VLSQNTWIIALKCHVVNYLDISKAMSQQPKRMLEKVKDSLANQFNYMKLGLNFEHMAEDMWHPHENSTNITIKGS
jgi:hypothetical protein